VLQILPLLLERLLLGLAWLWFLHRHGLGACLADDMGLGKTAQLLALMVAEREDGDAADGRPAPTLLVCPMSLVGNWQRETARFAPDLEVYVHHGTARTKARLVAAARRADLVITTYSLLAATGTCSGRSPGGAWPSTRPRT